MTDLHILMDPVSATKRFFFYFLFVGIFYTKVMVKLDPLKLNLKILNLACWSIATIFFVIHKKNPEQKKGFKGSLRSNLDKMIGGPKGAPSHPQELEVGGCRPPYLLVLHTNIRSKTY